jgi:hypothetical protein
MNEQARSEAAIPEYWHERDYKADKARARELFYGQSKRDPCTRLLYSEYPHDRREREALEALSAMLLWLHRAAMVRMPDLPAARAETCEAYEILALVALAVAPGNPSVDPPTGPTPRRLVPVVRKGEKRRNRLADLQVALHVAEQTEAKGKVESGVASAMETFGLSRKAIFEAQRRVRKAFRGIWPTHTQKR